MYIVSRYTYNWFTRYPKTINLDSYNRLAKLGQAKDKALPDDLDPKDLFLDVEETGGYSSLVVSLMAQRKVGSLVLRHITMFNKQRQMDFHCFLL